MTAGRTNHTQFATSIAMPKQEWITRCANRYVQAIPEMSWIDAVATAEVTYETMIGEPIPEYYNNPEQAALDDIDCWD